MAYTQKKYLKYKKNYKKGKKRWYNRKYTPAEVAYRAFQGVNYLRGLVNSELMKVDILATQTVNDNPASTNPFINLTNISQGDADGNRTGSSIFVRSVNGTIAFEKHLSAVYTYVRWAIVIDLQQIGDAAPLISDFLAGNWESHLKKETVGRFQILKTGTVNLNNNYPQRLVKFNCAMRHHVRYNGTTGNDIQKGAIWLMYMGNEATNFPTTRHDIRVSYHDN